MKIDTNPSCNNPQEFIENLCKTIAISILDSIIYRISDLETGEITQYTDTDEISDLKSYLDISLKVARVWDKAINKNQTEGVRFVENNISQPEDKCPKHPKTEMDLPDINESMNWFNEKTEIENQ